MTKRAKIAVNDILALEIGHSRGDLIDEGKHGVHADARRRVGSGTIAAKEIAKITVAAELIHNHQRLGLGDLTNKAAVIRKKMYK